MALSFAVNWDYRCPFARNAHEHVVSALQAGADWDVDFVAFSLSQGHREEGDPPVWEDPAKARDLLAMQAGIVVRDRYPDLFLEVLGHAEVADVRPAMTRDGTCGGRRSYARF